MASSGEVTVGYWLMRGRAGPVRNLLSYCGIPFQNKNYTNFEEWFAQDKSKMNCDYPNLPYLKDGDKTVTETNAILHYVPIRAGKRELLGDTDDKFIQVETALSVNHDLAFELMRILFGDREKFDAAKDEAFSKGRLKSIVEALNRNLKDREWQTGFFSIADFSLFEMVELIHDMDAAKLEPYPHLLAFLERFREIPEIKAHRESDKFVKSWFLPGRPCWNNTEASQK
jgi:glutathione S-transferase